VLTGETVAAGDVVLGLAASGLHSNGFSLVRRVVDTLGLDYAQPAPFAPDKSLGEALLIPTRIYVKSCLAALEVTGAEARGVKALAHITGGGFLENLPRVIPAGLGVTLDGVTWPVPEVFRWLADFGGIAPQEMVRTFNCGVGMAVVVDPAQAEAVRGAFEAAGETVFDIGHITAHHGDGGQVTIANLEQTWPL
jgi:phosphoribosylformylglycinamidine cyclo-ligase